MKIIHVMADGTVLKNINGRVVPKGNEGLKRVLSEILRHKQKTA